MATFNGTLLGVYITDGDPASDKLIAAAQDVSLSLSAETIDVTTKQSGGFRQLLPGLRSGTMSVNGLIDYAASGTDKDTIDLWTAFESKTRLALRFQKDPDNDVAGDMQIYAYGYITSLEQSAGTEDTATYSATFELDHTINEAIVA